MTEDRNKDRAKVVKHFRATLSKAQGEEKSFTFLVKAKVIVIPVWNGVDVPLDVCI